MDLSKLPKLSESPAPPSAQVPLATEIKAPRQVAPLLVGELALDVAISLVIGMIFMMLGSPFGGWLIARMSGVPYNTGVNWTTGPDAGKPVELFELLGGGGWLYMGEWVLGACLVLEAFLIGLAILSRGFARKLIFLAMLLGGIGALANVIAIIQQVRMGFTSPIYSLVGLLIGVVMIFAHGRHVFSNAQR